MPNLNEALIQAQNLAQLGTWAYDFELNQLAWSETLFKLLDADPISVTPSYSLLIRRVHPEDRSMLNAEYRNSLKNQTSCDLEFRLLDADGEIRVFRWCSDFTISKQSTGKKNYLKRVHGYIQDITVLKSMESDLLSRQADAERANRSKSEFLAMMSHDIRTPLNAILGMSESLEKTPLNQDQFRKLQIINSAGQSILRLANDILDLTRIESGQIELSIRPMKLSALAEGVKMINQLEALRKRLELKVTLSPDLPDWVYGDAKCVRQVITNLVSNAIKFTSEGFVELSIFPLGPDQIRMRVVDSGPGIRAESLESIFDVFVQDKEANHHIHFGFGLGLSICKQLVEQMNGTIEAFSIYGSGSCFTVTLPLKSVDKSQLAERLPEPKFHTPAKKQAKVIEGPIRVLLADDSEDNLYVIKTYLEDDFELEFAQDGEEAVRLFEHAHFDVVLLDIMMPKMDGYDAARAMRQIETRRGSTPTPIIALTACAMKGDMKKSFAAGCNLHISKPVRKKSLLGALSYFVRLEEGQKTAPEALNELGSLSQPVTFESDSIIDQDIFETLQRETGSSFHKVLELFVNSLPERIDAVALAYRDKHRDNTLKVAHKLKGSASTFGACKIQSLCTDIEAMVRDDHWQDESHCIDQLVAEGELAISYFDLILKPTVDQQ